MSDELKARADAICDRLDSDDPDFDDCEEAASVIRDQQAEIERLRGGAVPVAKVCVDWYGSPRLRLLVADPGPVGTTLYTAPPAPAVPTCTGQALEMSLIAGQYLRQHAPELLTKQAIDVLSEVDRRRSVPPAPAVPEAVKVGLAMADRLVREALPKFNWSASALDANALSVLNEAPGAIRAAMLAAAPQVPAVSTEIGGD